MLAVLLVAELSLCVLAFVFSSAVKRKVVEVLQMQAIVHYRDDDDLRNLVDWTQNTVSIARDSTSRHLDRFGDAMVKIAMVHTSTGNTTSNYHGIWGQ